MRRRSCLIPDCNDSNIRARGWCNTHYRRWQRHGDPSIFRPKKEFCLNGHRLVGKNLYISPKNGKRQCANCRHARSRAWAKANREKSNAQHRAWAKANPEKSRKWARAWANANTEKVRTQRRARYWANPEKAAARAHAKYLANPEKIKERNRAWKKDNPDKYRAIMRNNRARRADAGGDGVSELEWAALCEAVNECCFYCGERDEMLEMDHVIPLIPKKEQEQGQHSFENVLPACRFCNRNKSNQNLDEWYGPATKYLRRRHKRLIRRARMLLDAWAAA